MTFVTLLLALLTERFLLDQQGWRQATWFRRYIELFAHQEYGIWIMSRYWGSLLILAPPLLLIGLTQAYIADAVDGLIAFIFALFILVYSFGPEDLDNQTAEFIEAQDRGDDKTAKARASDLCDLADDAALSPIQRVTNAVLYQANQRLFAVIFWFLILGPLGALLYRLACHLTKIDLVEEDDTNGTDLFRYGCQRLLFILDWLPSRLITASFALAGNFDHTLYGWKSWKEQGLSEDAYAAQTLLIHTGRGALMLEEGSEESTDQIEAALTLIWRSLVIWLVVLGLLLLAL
jgi:membrane protein required for beta-lactamase induction